MKLINYPPGALKMNILSSCVLADHEQRIPIPCHATAKLTIQAKKVSYVSTIKRVVSDCFRKDETAGEKRRTVLDAFPYPYNR